MRLVDLLLVLLFEGRKALSRTGMGCVGAGQLIPRFRRMDSAGEKSHRQLIDCIRSKDTDALVEAIDTGGIEVNFMDDVGQTLLNWASAFGTQEMVEFLCDRGADVNKGQRSSHSTMQLVLVAQRLQKCCFVMVQIQICVTKMGRLH